MEHYEKTAPQITKFWDDYTALLKSFRIPKRAIPWYHRHIEAFLTENPGVKLRSHSAETINLWLEHTGRDTQVSTWQYRQKVDALRILFGHFLRAEWCSRFDWDRWLNGARALESDHATIARTYEMIEKSIEAPKNYMTRRYPDLYRRFLVAVRLPNYAMNTEKSYLHWINRFLDFHNNRHPCDCNEPDIASFLEHLTIQRKIA